MDMNTLNQNLKTVTVEYLDTPGYKKSYNFITDRDDIKQGDTVVVDSRNGLGLAKVSLVIKGVSAKAKMWVVDRVDLSGFEERKQKAEKAKELMTAMEQRRKGLEKIAVYKMMAESDPGMKKMYEEYAELMGLSYDQAIVEMANKES